MGTIFGGLSTASHRPTLTPFKRRLYLANGWDAVRVWDGISATDESAGIVGPSIETTVWVDPATEAGAGVVANGVHKYRYRYKNSKTGFVSNPSAEREFESNGLFNVRFAVGGAGDQIVRSTDPKVDTIVLEGTLLGGSVFFLAAEIANSVVAEVIFNQSDEALAEQELVWEDFGHNVPPIFKHLVAFKDRLFGFGQVDHADGTITTTGGSTTVTGVGTNWSAAVVGRFLRVGADGNLLEIASFTNPTSLELVDVFAGTIGAGQTYKIVSINNDVFFSHETFPESWPSFNFFEGLLEERVRAMVGFGNGLVLFGLRHMERFTWSDTPELSGYKRPLPGERGALNQRVVVVLESAIYAMDRGGIHIFQGSEPEHISRPVDRRMRDLVDFELEDEFHAVYYQELRAIRWFVVKKGETKPKLYFEYEVERKVWSTGELETGLTASAVLPRGRGLGTQVGDENGHKWWDDVGTVMGGLASVSNALADKGSTDTIIIIQDSGLPSLGIGLAGVLAHFVKKSETRLISSNTDQALTLATPFSEAPKEGDEIHLGRIVSKLRTRQLYVNTLRNTMQGTWLWVFFEPLGTDRELRVRLYRNFSALAHSEWKGASASLGKLRAEGVTPPADGETDFVVNLRANTGVVKISLGFKHTRVVAAEIEAREPDTPLRLFGYEFQGEPKETLI